MLGNTLLQRVRVTGVVGAVSTAEYVHPKRHGWCAAPFGRCGVPVPPFDFPRGERPRTGLAAGVPVVVRARGLINLSRCRAAGRCDAPIPPSISLRANGPTPPAADVPMVVGLTAWHPPRVGYPLYRHGARPHEPVPLSGRWALPRPRSPFDFPQGERPRIHPASGRPAAVRGTRPRTVPRQVCLQSSGQTKTPNYPLIVPLVLGIWSAWRGSRVMAARRARARAL